MVVNPNIEIIEVAAEKLNTLTEGIVFVGGCATGLLLTDQAAAPVRVTVDVDVLVEVATLVEYYTLSEQLRQLGFVEDSSEGAPICRWKSEDIILDVMPTDPMVLGFENRWFKLAYNDSEWTALPSGRRIRLLSAPFFLATKIVAFSSRGNNDYLMSRDMEDIIALFDGRPEIVSEVEQADGELKNYLVEKCATFLKERDFLDALPGHLLPDAASQERAALIIRRLKTIVGI